MADIPRAADLPEGSVVASRTDAWVKQPMCGLDQPDWAATDRLHRVEGHVVDYMLTEGRAKVLRHGYGEESR